MKIQNHIFLRRENFPIFFQSHAISGPLPVLASDFVKIAVNFRVDFCASKFGIKIRKIVLHVHKKKSTRKTSTIRWNSADGWRASDRSQPCNFLTVESMKLGATRSSALRRSARTSDEFSFFFSSLFFVKQIHEKISTRYFFVLNKLEDFLDILKNNFSTFETNKKNPEILFDRI